MNTPPTPGLIRTNATERAAALRVGGHGGEDAVGGPCRETRETETHVGSDIHSSHWSHRAAPTFLSPRLTTGLTPPPHSVAASASRRRGQDVTDETGFFSLLSFRVERGGEETI